MSVPYLREAVLQNQNDKVLRFVRLHLGDGNEETGRKEIEKSWVEATKLLLDHPPVDQEFIDTMMSKDAATLGLLFFHLHFALIRRSGEWIHDGSR